MIYFDENKNAYAFKIDNPIFTCDEALWADCQANERKYIWQKDKLILNPNYEKEKQQQEENRLNNLTMTALDFINVVKEAGATSEEIKEYLNKNADLELQLICCKDVYCGVVRKLLPLEIANITLTDNMIVDAFKAKNNLK